MSCRCPREFYRSKSESGTSPCRGRPATSSSEYPKDIIIKNLLVSLIVALTIGAALPAFAGPDFQAIEQARKAHRATQIARHGDTQAPASADQNDRPSQALVLPLDHGLRAEAQARNAMAATSKIAAVDQRKDR